MNMVEKGEVEGTKVETAVRAVIEPVLEDGADTLVLGCTHFSFLAPTIVKVAGPQIRVIHPAPAVAAQTSRIAKDVGAGETKFVASGELVESEYLLDRLTKLERHGPALPFPS